MSSSVDASAQLANLEQLALNDPAVYAALRGIRLIWRPAYVLVC